MKPSVPVPIVTILFCCTAFFSSLGQQSKITNVYPDNPNTKKLKIERRFIYVPTTAWFYSHHQSIVHYRDRFFAIWSNGKKDEDAPGQRVRISESKDFLHWSEPSTLANPDLYKKDTLNVLTAAGFHVYRDTLVAYYGQYSPGREHTNLHAVYTTDGKHWSKPIDLHLAVNPNHGPQALASGRLIISGNFTYPYTDDPSGLRGWKMNSFYPDSYYTEDNPDSFYTPAKRSGYPPLCEGSFYQTDDGTIHTLMRVTDEGWKGLLWQIESKDNGTHWSGAMESGFTDNDSKFHFGRLPDKRFYYVGIPDTAHRSARVPLVLTLSSDGLHFDKNFILADEPYVRKKEGQWKEGEYGYPHTIVYNGYLYVIISRMKESVEVLRVSLDQLK